MAQTLREQLQAAYDKAAEEDQEPEEVTEETEEEEKAEEPNEEKDEGQDEKPEENAVEEPDEEEPEEELPPPPSALNADIRAKWKEIPAEVREEFIRLEKTQQDGFDKIKEDVNFGKNLRQVVQPYEAMIRADGGTVDKAVQGLLNTAYVLRTGSPAQKAQVLNDVARQYGVDVDAIGQDQEFVDPNTQYMQQRLESLEHQLKQQIQHGQQTQAQTLQQQIDEFAKDHDHFNAVRSRMSVLVGSGAAKDLQDAYDQACWADPEIRAQILADQKKAEEAERKKAAKAEVAKKKQAAASVKGSAAKTSSDQSSELSRRDLIAQQIYGSDQRI